MENRDTLIETIRAATVGGAADDARAAGARACRTLLAVLDTKPGEPIATPPPTARETAPAGAAAPAAAPAPMPNPAAAAQALAAMLHGMTPDQLLDLAIARLRAALPTGVSAPTVQGVRFQLVPVHGHTPEGAAP